MKMQYLIKGGLVASGVAIGGVLVFFLMMLVSEQNVEIKPLKDITQQQSLGNTATYQSDRFNFSLTYPNDLIIKEFDDGPQSGTAVFQKPNELVGFQVYVTPHTSNTISGKTILRDVASGVVIDLKEEELRNGLLVATFWSEAPLTGRNRELWFLHDGFLFEFTAYAAAEGADEWLKSIVETITFDGNE